MKLPLIANPKAESAARQPRHFMPDCKFQSVLTAESDHLSFAEPWKYIMS